jgi:hypothetical protein
MVVNIAHKSNRKFGSQSGQAVIELLFLLPVFIAVVFLGYKANTAVQAAIVNQRYLRAHLLALQRNHAYYPHSRYMTNLQSRGMNQFIMAISSEKIDERDSGTAFFVKFSLKRSGAQPERRADEEGDASSQRGATEVLVRSTVSLCTPVVSNAQARGAQASPSAIGLTIPQDPRQYGGLFCNKGDIQ